jgi:myosin I
MTTRRRVVAVKKTVDVSRVIIGTEDMVLLQNSTEDGVVANLQSRLEASELYTNIGHVLVACNPYKWLDIYDDATIKKYVHQQRVDVAPHIFATAEAAYRAMITEEDNQCVIISGESGAGKTEASKQIQSYIAAVCGGAGGESVDKIKRVFLGVLLLSLSYLEK